MPSYSFPSIDTKNPLYCPSVPAAVYIDSLRRRLDRNRSRSKRNSKSRHKEHFLRSFARILDNALLSGDSDDENPNIFPRHKSLLELSPDDENTLGFEYAKPAWEQDDMDDSSDNPDNPWISMRGQPIPKIPPGLPNLKRKRTTFSDIYGPAKHAKSFQSIHESSFDISVKHEKLQYSGFASPRSGPYLKTIEPGPNAESTPHVHPGHTSNVDGCLDMQFKSRIRALEGAQILISDVTLCAYTWHRRTLWIANRN